MGEARTARPWTASRGRVLGTPRALAALAFYASASALAVLFMAPFAWAVGSSLKEPAELVTFPPALWPATPRWDNYARVWTSVPFGQFTLNTVVVTVAASAGQMISAAAVAYGFARFRFPGREGLFMLCLSAMMLPWEVTIVPHFILYRMIGWLDTLAPLIVPYWFGGGAFYIFLMRQFFMTIPLDFDEAAKMDGASYPRIFWSIILPLAKPAMTTVAIFSFLYHWNEFITPLIFLNSPERFVLSLGLRYFQTLPAGGELREHLLMAASMMTTLPTLVVFFLAQRHFVRGIVMTGIKG
jgi:ABC-type glycerol-3-phosphate transport system permease component